MSKNDYGLFKDGNYYGLISYRKGQQIMTEQKKKGCDVCHSDTVISIMSPGWKPRPPRYDPYRDEWHFVKSIKEFK